MTGKKYIKMNVELGKTDGVTPIVLTTNRNQELGDNWHIKFSKWSKYNLQLLQLKHTHTLTC